MKLVGIREARAVIGDLVRAAREGEDVVLTDRGAPVVLLVPIEDKQLTLSPEFAARLLRRHASAKPARERRGGNDG